MLYVRLPEGRTVTFESSDLSTVKDLQSKLEHTEGLSFENLRIFHNSKTLSEVDLLEEGSTLEVQIGLLGGVGASGIPDHLRDLAMKYKCNKMICRKCYARLPASAHNCRKRKCGHCANIRPKKKIKEKEKGK